MGEWEEESGGMGGREQGIRTMIKTAGGWKRCRRKARSVEIVIGARVASLMTRSEREMRDGLFVLGEVGGKGRGFKSI